MGISVICIAKNEEAHIEKAIRSAKKIADEVVVVDSGSTDKTKEIAKKYTDKVFDKEWEGYGKQKNFAIQQCTHQWIIQIDADEEIPDLLAEEIRSELADPKYSYYWFKIVTVFLGKPLWHLAGNNLRLFNKTYGKWDDKEVHEQVVRISDGTSIKLGDSDSGRLKNFLLHHSHYQTIAAYLERQEKYSSADALEMLKTGHDRSGKQIERINTINTLPFLFHRAIKQFIRKFFWQKGILDGCQGWLWCFFSAQYEYKMCRKYLRLIKNQ